MIRRPYRSWCRAAAFLLPLLALVARPRPAVATPYDYIPVGDPIESEIRILDLYPSDALNNRLKLPHLGIRPWQAIELQGAGRQQVTVNAQQRWTDTGINVRAGDVITFSANGQIQMSDDSGDTATPAGSRRGRTAPDAPVQGQLAGGLLARIGEWSPMFVGNKSSVTAPVSGRLYLGVNDDHLADNRGEFTVTVGVQGRTLR